MSLSSGSLSLDLQDMWRDGCPKSPDLDSDMDAGAESEKMGEYDMKNLRHVLEVSFWEMIRPFLVPDDVFGMRTTASRWSVASLYGPHAELFSFSWKGSPSTNLSPSRRECDYGHMSMTGCGTRLACRLPTLIWACPSQRSSLVMRSDRGCCI